MSGKFCFKTVFHGKNIHYYKRFPSDLHRLSISHFSQRSFFQTFPSLSDPSFRLSLLSAIPLSDFPFSQQSFFQAFPSLRFTFFWTLLADTPSRGHSFSQTPIFSDTLFLKQWIKHITCPSTVREIKFYHNVKLNSGPSSRHASALTTAPSRQIKNLIAFIYIVKVT